MAKNNYESDSLIGKYIHSCVIARQPLSDTQIGLLEKTINAAFGIRKNKSPPIDVFKSFDSDTLNDIARNESADPGRLINILKKYREKNLETPKDLPLSEADAWSLYSLTEQEIEKTTYKTLKEKHKLPKTYGFTSFKLLHEYFIAKGVIEKDSHFPLPKDF